MKYLQFISLISSLSGLEQGQYQEIHLSMVNLFHNYTVRSFKNTHESRTLSLADDVPVHLIFNNLFPYGIMMLTPIDLNDFAYGYCFTEEIITNKNQIISLHIIENENDLSLHITLTGPAFHRLLRRRPRLQMGQSSCGLCGNEQLPSTSFPSIPTTLTHGLFTQTSLQHALASLHQWQTLNAQTHMVHAAAWADITGHIQFIREDIGRHNALDKLIGTLIRNDVPISTGVCLLTSRYSYEMSFKTLRAQMPIVVAVSAPTSRALQLAQQYEQTLIAIARHHEQWIFSGEQRLEII